ncbi:metallophosphoesterase [Paenibacillus sp. alder61]|uniref:metallophosphoesterase family protein n=1 Tax=Paenibacillus sp. alder61 TaxID=2862948 RepID=UPI001CD40D91|nr:metallophosphoesterase family protein [Paenibacillus sp. alder61]MCA1296345.1 metallophosphoesterase [Paenibacillus sp. alder61]
MRIGVVSDTHMPKKGKELPPALLAAFQRLDLIIHLGDWTSLLVYDQLAALAPVEGIAGNNDPGEIVRRFGYRKILTLGHGRVRVGLTHGHLPEGRGTAREKAGRAFPDERLDAILFGHSHKPLLERENGILLFNPGSPTDKRKQKYYSAGILEVTNSGLTAKHLYFERSN